jgi:hypothetical protein
VTGHEQRQRMILCAGLQSGGTTLISWCFLQRRDTNGVLDMPHDIIQTSFDKVREPVVWCKMTVGAFRWLDVSQTYRDLGWNPEPLLIVRDARAAYASLMKKDWGFNGTTAEEPPLRMRFRRFLEDWDWFRANNWPVMKYEDLIQDARRALMGTCQCLRLNFDEGMFAWPKRLSDIAYVGSGQNETFARSIEQGSLPAAQINDLAKTQIDSLPQSELDWLERAFTDFNSFHQYPAHVSTYQEATHPMQAPRFEGTTREWYYAELERLRAKMALTEHSCHQEQGG